jgi:hypothetical protein
LCKADFLGGARQQVTASGTSPAADWPGATQEGRRELEPEKKPLILLSAAVSAQPVD